MFKILLFLLLFLLSIIFILTREEKKTSLRASDTHENKTSSDLVNEEIEKEFKHIGITSREELNKIWSNW